MLNYVVPVYSAMVQSIRMRECERLDVFGKFAICGSQFGLFVGVEGMRSGSQPLFTCGVFCALKGDAQKLPPSTIHRFENRT
jgi:hypothetical protein